MKNYTDIRNKYSEFIYRKFEYKLADGNLICDFYYEVAKNYDIKHGLNFKHSVVVENVDEKLFRALKVNILDNLIFHIGLVEMLSYWKVTCSPTIKIEAGSLNKDQAAWLRKLLMKGMMQYFYTNKIDFTTKDFIKIESFEREDEYESPRLTINFNNPKPLVTVGGGKDSAVTLGIISQEFSDYSGLVIKPSSASSFDLLETTKTKNVITVERKIDQKIIELNNSGFLNGHIPYSASLYFISLLTAYIYGYTDILFSNESSSNEGNLNYLGNIVNHQYSKTLEFENDFRDYNQRYLSNIRLFSFLRPLNELQISKLFSGMPEYFSVIRSCNTGQQEGIWCGKCPKCLSTFILLFPFLGKEKTVKVFGNNLLEDKILLTLLDQLTSDNEIKPFECVGTRMEMRIALNMAERIYGDNKMPILLKRFINLEDYDKKQLGEVDKDYLSSWGENNLPEMFKELLRKNLK